MSLDNVRSALQLLSGAGELTRAKAVEAASTLLAVPQQIPGARETTERAGQLAGQVGTLADELIAAAAANQENIRSLVRHELDGQLQKVGLVSSGELASARAEIDRLKDQISALRREVVETGEPTPAQARKRPTRTSIAARSTPPAGGAESADDQAARPAKTVKTPTKRAAQAPAPKKTAPAAAKKAAKKAPTAVKAPAKKSTPPTKKAAKKSPSAAKKVAPSRTAPTGAGTVTPPQQAPTSDASVKSPGAPAKKAAPRPARQAVKKAAQKSPAPAQSAPAQTSSGPASAGPGASDGGATS